MNWNISSIKMQKLVGLAIACLVVGVAMASFAVAPTDGGSTAGGNTLAATISR